MSDFDFDEQFTCEECGESYELGYSETAPDAVFCPFCGNECLEHIDKDDYDDRDDKPTSAGDE